MTDPPEQHEPTRPTSRGRRYKPNELALADGGRLSLHADGSIHQLDAHGATTQAWKPDDAGWPDQALRFGLHPQALTVAPHDHRHQGTKPRRW